MWEYKIEFSPSDHFINDLGRQGWNLVTVTNEPRYAGSTEMSYKYIFKRWKGPRAVGGYL